jgi:hypothetical protein
VEVSIMSDVRRFAYTLSLLLLGVLLFASPAKAEPRGHEKRGDRQENRSVAEVVFSEIERRVIRDYFESRASDAPRAKGLPPGLAKRRQLPPGLAKRSTLPPGLAKREIPADLAARLGVPARGRERWVVGSDVVLVESGTNLVLDVLRDVVRGGHR